MKMTKCAGLGALMVLFSTGIAAEEAPLDTEMKQYSYAMGYSIGSQILGQFGAENIELDADAFSRAIRDAISQSEPSLEPDKMQAVVMARRDKQMAAQKMAADEARRSGEAFLKENGVRDGVVTTDSGLQYEVMSAGDGAMPKLTDTVVVHYRGTLLNGTEFDSSYSRNEPATFPLEGIIPGWQEALQLMKTGDKWKVFIPSELGYGERGGGGRIGPNEVLTFEIELIEIK